MYEIERKMDEITNIAIKINRMPMQKSMDNVAKQFTIMDYITK